MIGVSACAAASSSAADSAYTVASDDTATSRAAMPGISAMQICQLKPIGAKIVGHRMADAAGEAVVDRRHRRAGRRAGKRQQEPQQDRQRQDDAADALEEDRRALPQADQQVARMRHAVRRQLQHQRMLALVAAPLLHHPRHDQRAEDAGDVQREQHQALQVEHAADLLLRE